jgi:hypothetical protein
MLSTDFARIAVAFRLFITKKNAAVMIAEDLKR